MLRLFSKKSELLVVQSRNLAINLVCYQNLCSLKTTRSLSKTSSISLNTLINYYLLEYIYLFIYGFSLNTQINYFTFANCISMLILYHDKMYFTH